MSGFSTPMPPPTVSACHSLPATANMNSLKKCPYQQRIREVEHASFTPLVLLATGGWLVKLLFFLQEIGFMSGYKVGPILLLDPAYAAA